MVHEFSIPRHQKRRRKQKNRGWGMDGYTPVIEHSWLATGPFEDVFPIKNGDIPASYVSLREGTSLVVFFPTHLKKMRKSNWIISASLGMKKK